MLNKQFNIQNNITLFLEKMQLVFKSVFNDEWKSEYENFEDWLNSNHLQNSSFSFRINKKKLIQLNLTVDEFIASLPHIENEIYKNSFDGYSFVSKNKIDFTKNTLLEDGLIYPQDLTGIYFKNILNQIFKKIYLDAELDLDLILDLCAAPGGKSLIISDLLYENQLENANIISNEIVGKRNKVLVENIDKWDVNNIIVTQNDTIKFGAHPDFFDLIIVDPPCTGEGVINNLKDEFFDEYSENLVKINVNRQIEILRNCAPSLKMDGYLLYSTCSYNLQENEEIMQYAEENLGFEIIPLDFVENLHDGVISTSDGFLRFFPNKFSGAGGFMALLKKADEYSLNVDDSPSIWKQKRINQPKIIIESKNNIKQLVLKNEINLQDSLLYKYDLQGDIPNVIYLCSNNLFNNVKLLNQCNFKITYGGRAVATYGKNLEKSLKFVG